MQKRIVRKLDLERFISQVEPHPSPSPSLEQYTISADVATTMLHIAAYANNDIAGKTVLDLGCGTGRLALGAAFLGARQAIGVDIDKVAVEAALKNSVKTGLRECVQWVAADIDVIRGVFDTVLQNPPFGVQRRRADRKFLEKALKVGKVIYSLHKNPAASRAVAARLKAHKANVEAVRPSPFLDSFIEEHGGRIRGVYAMVMTVPHMFDFHTKKRHGFVVDLYVIEGGHQSSRR
jgi:putative methylase